MKFNRKFNLKSKLKHVRYFFDIVNQKSEKNYFRKNERNKKLYNFISADNFIEKYNNGEVIRNIFSYEKIDLYTFDDCYISCCNNCAFVHKYVDNKMHTFRESSGNSVMLDTKEMFYAKPQDMISGVNIYEDEVCLLCFISCDNYWHVTFDIIPRLMIMMKENWYKGKFLINDTRCARQFCELLSIPEERIIYNKCGDIIHAKKVHIFSDMFGIDVKERFLKDTRDFIIKSAEKKYGPLDDKKMPERIYVPRVLRRKITNENKIIEILRNHKFEIIVPENLSVYDQIKFFHNAKIIVTPHGANSANILYSKPKTSFVECFGHMWINPCMLYTIDLLDIDYHMLCERLSDYDENANKFSDYKINTLLLYCTIKSIIQQQKNK